MGLLRRLFGTNTPPDAPAALTTPAEVFAQPLDALAAPWTIRVLELCYFPVAGDRIDTTVTGDVGAPLAEIRRHVDTTSAAVARAVEAGSATHHYRNPASQPNVRFEMVDRLEIHEPLPTWNKPGHAVPMTDYVTILERVDIAHWVEDLGVDQVWIWGYHGGVIDLWESNMAGPHGDISNSDRDATDLPILDRTYTVYHYNYGRGTSEAVEDHMHQLEALFRHLDRDLFWDRFVGRTGEGRCGWAHFPPNGTRDYDWANRTVVSTDIEYWQPDGGTEVRLNSRRWNDDSLTWFVYWMQNLPGADNGLSYRGRPLNNWWWFYADLDDALASDAQL